MDYLKQSPPYFGEDFYCQEPYAVNTTGREEWAIEFTGVPLGTTKEDIIQKLGVGIAIESISSIECE